MSDGIDAIRQRHAMVMRPDLVEGRGEAWAAGHNDRGLLLAEVDLLRQSLVAIVEHDAEWDIRIHGSARARTTLRRLLGVDVDVPPAHPGAIGCWAPIHAEDPDLRAEVDRLTAELTEAREALDLLCRSIGRRATERTAPR